MKRRAVKNNVCHGLAVILVVTQEFLLPAQVVAALNQALPVPHAEKFVSHGQGNIDAEILGNQMVVHQLSDRAVFQWDSFNIANGYGVHFDQNSPEAIALNRIFQDDPSVIAGRLTADGSIYLINQNGIIFDSGAQIDVGSLIASTLDVDDDLIMNSSITQAIEQKEAAFFKGDQEVIGDILVMKDASLKAGENGRIFLFAPNIENNGSITSPKGQSILAAAEKVYLAASTDKDFRGLYVEVDQGGQVTNNGLITAEQGNITLMGLAVNQNGRVRASTSVDLNGSIRLLARDSVKFETLGDLVSTGKETELLLGVSALDGVDLKTKAARESIIPLATRSGSVVLGENSLTQVSIQELPDQNTPGVNKAVPDIDSDTGSANTLTSMVEVVGGDIRLEKNAHIVTPGGKVVILATDNPSNPVVNNKNNDSLIVMQEGSLIDVSGTTTTVLPMERNSLQVELRGFELRDSPLQRDGVLSGATVQVDLSRGEDLDIADISAQVAAIPKTANEHNSAGGSVDIISEGDFVFSSGAEIDISGGRIHYNDGYIQETRLLTRNGQSVPIGLANKDIKYLAVVGDNSIFDPVWAQVQQFDASALGAQGRFVPAYTQGVNAGAVNFKVNNFQYDGGQVRAETYMDPSRQSAVPDRGRLNIDLSAFNSSQQGIKLVSNDAFEELQQTYVHGTLREAADLALPDSFFNRSRAHLNVLSNTEFVQTADSRLDLAPLADFSATARHIHLDGQIRAPGGDVNFSANNIQNPNTHDETLVVSESAVINTSGHWVNDFIAGQKAGSLQPEVLAFADDAGSITLKSDATLDVQQGSRLKANAGAHLDNKGNLSLGRGGNITLAAGHFENGAGFNVKGSVESYGFFEGGRLSISAPGWYIGNPGLADLDDVVTQTPDFFQQGGFSAISLTASGDSGIVVASGTQIDLHSENLEFTGDTGSSLNLLASGSALETLTQTVLLPQYLRGPKSLNLQTIQVVASDRAVIEIQEGALIRTDPLGEVSLVSAGDIDVAGSILAPGGQINLELFADEAELQGNAVKLRAGSLLDVSAMALATTPDPFGLTQYQLFDAGKIKLNAKQGYALIEDGAVLDISGADQRIPDRSRQSNNPSATLLAEMKTGELAVTASEGIFFDGQIKAERSSLKTATGGVVSITLDETHRGGSQSEPFATYPLIVRVDDLEQEENFLDQALMNAGNLKIELDSRDDLSNGVAYIDIDTLNEAQLSRVNLKAVNTRFGKSSDKAYIEFATDKILTAQHSIRLNAPSILVGDHAAAVQAPYIALGVDDFSEQKIATLGELPGSGRFSAAGNFIEFIGSTEFADADMVDIASQGSIRFRGVQEGNDRDRLDARLNLYGDLKFTADQIYATSFTDAEINLFAENGLLSTWQNFDGEVSPVLSAASALAVNAAIIDHHGVIKAPMGAIDLNSDSITLNAGSVLSVSTDNQWIPFGVVDATNTWLYDVNAANPFVIKQLGDKTINLNAATVTHSEGATVDASGGGEVFSYQFTPGRGGSVDVLDNEHNNGAFAILPGLDGDSYAPYDFLYSEGAGIEMGASVYLSGTSGLASGSYAILPSRYALLPGAWLITPQSNQIISPQQGLQVETGAPLVAGKYEVANTAIQDSQWSAFVVEPGAIALSRSELKLFSANHFAEFSDGLLPMDGGVFNINATQSLDLSGQIKTQAVKGGNGGGLSIQGADILVSEERVDDFDGFQFKASELNELAVGSILLGGSRSVAENAQGFDLTVSSEKIVIDGSSHLEVAELLLVARDQIQIRAGASINAVKASSNRNSSLQLNGDGALLQVSSVDAFNVNRSNSTGAKGTLLIEEGATVFGSGALVMNSSLKTDLSGDFDTTGTLSFGAQRIILGGEKDPALLRGLQLSQALLNSTRATDFVFSSLSEIEFRDSVALQADNIDFDTSGFINGSGKDLKIEFQAGDTLTFANSGNSGLSENSDNVVGSVLSFSANKMLVQGDEAGGENEGIASRLVIKGFENSVFNADSGLVFAGTGELQAGGDVLIKAPVITAESGAVFDLDANGDLHLLVAGQTDAWLEGGWGAQVNFLAESIFLDSTVQLHSGSFSATARTGDVSLGDTALVDVSGQLLNLDGDIRVSDAGHVSFVSEQADVIFSDSAVIDLSPVENPLAGNSAQSGTLSLKATQGQALLNGSQIVVNSGSQAAEANTLNTGGHFIYDVGSNDQWVDVFNSIENAGFNGSISLRLRNGDIDLAEDQQLSADNISVSADQGAIRVAGLLDASRAEEGGAIYLASKADLELASTARLFARGNGDAAQGGQVDLVAREGGMKFDSGAVVDVSGGQGEGREGGRFSISVPYLDNGSAEYMQLNDQGLSVIGAEVVSVKPRLSYQADSVDNALLGQIKTDLVSFNNNRAALLSQLGGLADMAGLSLLPAVEVFSMTNIGVDTLVDFNEWRKHDSIERGLLTLRAAENLEVKQSISDGFNIESTIVFPNPVPVLTSTLIDTDSWSYQFIAGADLSSADIRQTLDGQGSFNLAAETLVRTGTGDMDFYLGHDLNFADDTARVYTAGKTTLKPYLQLGSEVLLADSGTLNPVDLAGKNFADGRLYYPFGGGDINIQVGGDINGAGAEHIHSEWLYRLSGENNFGFFLGSGLNFRKYVTTWGINYDLFNQGIGALGGGDISISAAGDIVNLGVAMPTTAMQIGANPDTHGQGASNEILLQGGGDLDISAGGSILSNHYFVDRGSLRVEAGLDIGRADSKSLGLMVAQGEGLVQLKAGRNIVLESVVQSSLVPVSKAQLSMQDKQDNLFFNPAVNRLSVESLYGDIELSFATDKIRKVFDPVLQARTQNNYRFFALAPAQFEATAFNGSILFSSPNVNLNTLLLAPSAETELSLLARHSIAKKTIENITVPGQLVMSELNPELLPGFDEALSIDLDNGLGINVFGASIGSLSAELGFSGAQTLFTENPGLFSASSKPVHIVALEGDIGSKESLIFSLSKTARIMAGNDIVNPQFYLQNNFTSDQSQVLAQRDIVVNTSRSASGVLNSSGVIAKGIRIEGPGDLQVIAGRNIDLGLSAGILSVGDGLNPSLLDHGANIWALAGMTTDANFDAYLERYLANDSENGEVFIDQLKASGLLSLEVIRSVSGESYSEDSQAVDIFNQLSMAQQKAVALHVVKEVAPESLAQQWIISDFFQQLKTAGTQDATGDIEDPQRDGFVRGFAAIDTLFPGDQWQGDINLAFSTIQAQDGGNIHLLTPGGGVDVGLPVTIPGFNKGPASLGIISFADGGIFGFADDSINVNQSRVKALDGGDVLLWSSEGDIDAGRGSKTALAVSPPLISEDEDGNIQVIFPPAVEGSGIQTTVSTPGKKPGSVFLFAPQGIVDAGDAGIASKGDVLIAAEQVVNADNIDVGGVSIGVPAATGVSASVAGLGGLGTSAADSAVENISEGAEGDDAQRQVGFLTVEIIGLGD